ncbi:tandem-95 repeat protein [Pseudodesulfovibrio sp. JC047]|uniref:VCBS domain-containing protein n=1 Tax=Pseudodesulfovibrio sp. JC047 TaxID=2683199 RepID=UPI0013D193B1|nr:VCBS domain-containing protein [Pseudodesulfovibrio sp. JC047]NDV19280.1 tandem-95 repeat protein [Pseudodesulfovibrio sp. JC047]
MGKDISSLFRPLADGKTILLDVSCRIHLVTGTVFLVASDGTMQPVQLGQELPSGAHIFIESGAISLGYADHSVVSLVSTDRVSAAFHETKAEMASDESDEGGRKDAAQEGEDFSAHGQLGQLTQVSPQILALQHSEESILASHREEPIFMHEMFEVPPLSVGVIALSANEVLHDFHDVASISLTMSGLQVIPPQSATISGQDTGLVIEDQKLSTQGQLSVVDPNLGQDHFVQSTLVGPLGTFSIGRNGQWNFVVDSTSRTVQALGVGKSLTSAFMVQSADGTRHQVLVEIDGTDDAPVLQAQSQSVTEDGAVLFGHMSATDIDVGDTLTYGTTAVVAGFSLHPDGSYQFDSSNPSYQHLAVGGAQTLSIPVTVTDSQGATSSQNLVITVHGTNDAPVLQAQSQSVTEDGAVLSGQLSATDIDTGDTLTYGTNAVVAGFTLHPDGSYQFDPTDSSYQHLAVGQTEKVSIPVVVTDSQGGTDTRTMEIVVTGTNDAPVVSGTTVLPSGTEDQPVTLLASDLLSHATDVDATDSLSVSNLRVDHGTILDNKDGTFTLSPEKDYNGQVHLIYDVVDGHGGTTPAQASMSVAAVGDAATITGVDTGDVTEDVNTYPTVSFLAHQIHTSGQLTITDPDSGEDHFDFKSFISWSARPDLRPYSSAHGGRLSIDQDGTWEYIIDTRKPEIQRLGVGDTLKDTVKIQSADGTEHTIEITIHGTNDAPTVSGATLLAPGTEDQPVTLLASDLLSHATDVDATDSLSVSNLRADHGTIIDNKDGTYTLSPEKDYNGQVHLTYDVVDTHGGSTPAQASMSVAAVGDAATISGVDTGDVTEDFDPYSPNSFMAHHINTSGQLTITDPDSGEDRFDFKAFISVPGHAEYRPYTTALGGLLAIEPDGAWTYAVDTRKPEIQRLGVGDTLKDTVKIQSADGTEHTIEITIHGANDAPTVSGVTLLAPGTEDQPVTLLASDLLSHSTDVDAGDSLSVSNLRADHGTIIDNKDGTFTLSLKKDYNGQVHLTYDVVDGHGGTTPAQASMSVAATGDAATIADVQTHASKISVTEDQGYINTHHELEYHGKLIIHDPDAGEDHFDVNRGPQTYTGIGYDTQLGGHVVLAADGTYSYSIDNRKDVIQRLGDGDSITDHVTIRSADGTTHDIAVVINGTNDAPVVSSAPDLGSTSEETPVHITAAQLLAGVSDIDSSSVSVVDGSLSSPHGIFTGTAATGYTFTPAKDFHGTDLDISYKVTDGSLQTPAHATIDVTPVTDPASVGVTMSAEQEVISTGTVDGRIMVGDIAAGQPLRELTLEFTVIGHATGTSGGSQGPVIFNFGDATHNNMLSLWNPANMKVGGAGDHATGVNLEDGNSHRITLTWESSSGDLKVFDNGNLVSTIPNYHKGGTLPEDAYMVLGQKLNHPENPAAPGWNSAEHYQGEVFNAALAHHALSDSEVAKAPLASQLDHASGLLLDVRSVGGHLVDTTGTHSLTDEGDLGHVSSQVDTSLTPPPPGSLLHLDVDVTAPADSQDQVTGTTIDGFPVGTLLSDGHHSVTVGTNPVDVDGWDLDHLTAQLHGAASNFLIAVTAETTGPDGQTASHTSEIPVNMDLNQPLAVPTAHDEPLSDDEQDAIDAAFLAQTDGHDSGHDSHESPIDLRGLGGTSDEDHDTDHDRTADHDGHESGSDAAQEAAPFEVTVSLDDLLQPPDGMDSLLAGQPEKAPVAAPPAEAGESGHEGASPAGGDDLDGGTPDASVLDANLVDSSDDEHL